MNPVKLGGLSWRDVLRGFAELGAWALVLLCCFLFIIIMD